MPDRAGATTRGVARGAWMSRVVPSAQLRDLPELVERVRAILNGGADFIKLIATGEKLDQIEDFDPGRIAGRILGMGDIVGLVEEVHKGVDVAAAQKLADKRHRLDELQAGDQAVEAARMGWGVACMTGVAGKGETLDIVPRFLITGRRVMGASFGGVKGREQVPQLVDRWLAGDIDVEPLVSRTVGLDDVNEAFTLMEAQDGIRSVITYS